jgi:hypothetical protein
MSGVFDKYLLERLPLLAPRTQRDYRGYLRNLRLVFGTASPQLVEPGHVFDYRNKRAERSVVEGDSRGFLINHLQRLPAPFPGTRRHNNGTPSLRSSQSRHTLTWRGGLAQDLPTDRRKSCRAARRFRPLIVSPLLLSLVTISRWPPNVVGRFCSRIARIAASAADRDRNTAPCRATARRLLECGTSGLGYPLAGFCGDR